MVYKNVSSEQVDVRQYNENLMQSQEIGGGLPSERHTFFLQKIKANVQNAVKALHLHFL